MCGKKVLGLRGFGGEALKRGQELGRSGKNASTCPTRDGTRDTRARACRTKALVGELPRIVGEPPRIVADEVSIVRKIIRLIN